MPLAPAEPMVGGDTHALIVSASRLFHNYRHASNALLVYDAVKRLGLRDSSIVLMLAGDITNDARNEGRPSMYGSNNGVDLHGRGVEVDYRQEEVTVDNFLGVLTDRLPDRGVVSASKRLHSGPRSRLLLYLTGHGGDGFLKFNDQFELAASDLAAAVRNAYFLGRFSELLVLTDTCQASTMPAPLHEASLLPPPDGSLAAPRIASMSSSELGQNSFSHEVDSRLGVATSDRFTFELHSFMRRLAHAGGGAAAGGVAAAASLADLEQYMLRHARLRSSIVSGASGWNASISGGGGDDLRAVRLMPFVGARTPRLRTATGACTQKLPRTAATAAVTAAAAATRPERWRRSRSSYASWRRSEYDALWGHLPVDQREGRLVPSVDRRKAGPHNSPKHENMEAKVLEHADAVREAVRKEAIREKRRGRRPPRASDSSWGVANEDDPLAHFRSLDGWLEAYRVSYEEDSQGWHTLATLAAISALIFALASMPETMICLGMRLVYGRDWLREAEARAQAEGGAAAPTGEGASS